MPTGMGPEWMRATSAKTISSEVCIALVSPKILQLSNVRSVELSSKRLMLNGNLKRLFPPFHVDAADASRQRIGSTSTGISPALVHHASQASI